MSAVGLVLMYDSTVASRIPADALAAAGYVDGRWPTYQAVVARLPSRPVLSIATSPASDAMVLDVEGGDATPAAAAAWVARQHRRGYQRPCLYTSLGAVPTLQDALREAGIPRSAVRLWTAHWTGSAHICSKRELRALEEPPGATQYATDSSAGVDVSITTEGWLDAVLHDYRHNVKESQ